MRKAFLQKKLNRLEQKKKSLATRAQEAQSAEELRSINEEIDELAEEIGEAREELELLENDEPDEKRSEIPHGAKLVKPLTVGSFRAPEEKRDTDPYDTMEYREAFKKFAQTGEKIPENLIRRDGEPANTNSLGATIPTTVLNEFINEVRKRYGNLYMKVRKMNIKGAVKVPIAELQATFKWISEDNVSPRQDGGKIKDFVEFSYNMAEIRVAQTLLSEIVTLDLFEREIVRVMTIAYLQAMDTAIVKGTGVGQPLGILNDTRIPATHQIEMSASDMGDWTKWRKNFFAKLPLGYRSGEFIFPLSTVDSYLETMADSNNNPIFRQATGLEVNDGDSTDPNGRFFGRNISLVEPDILPDFDEAASGDIVGIFWQPEEYAVNTNMQFGMRRWFDEDRNEWVNKMLTVVDGKILNPMGFYLIKKK